VKCWLCTRQARGFGHADIRFSRGDPRRYPLDWVFCSRRCQAVFHALYGGGQPRHPASSEAPPMVDPTETERALLRACLRYFGEAAGAIGFDKPLGAYSEAEALQVIEAVVTGWTEGMAEHHADTRHPAVRGLPPVTDPFSDQEIPF
jgi:hypothetical protein